MLGRSANGIFWLFRYLERAENTVRVIEAALRMALTRDAGAAAEEWRSVLVTLGLQSAYAARHGTEVSGLNVCNFVLRDRDNAGSVLAMIDMARTNARMVRTGITREVWEAVNESWMKLKDMLARPVNEARLRDVLDTVRRQATQVRGAMEGTMLRNDIFCFARIGTFVERADNTARILNVKYYVLLPGLSVAGTSLDNVQWDNVLRAVAGERAYRWLHAGQMDPRGIARFLILDARFPRSLAFCYDEMAASMAQLEREYGFATPAHAIAAACRDRLANLTIEAIFDQGLQPFIAGVLGSSLELAQQIQRDYRFVD